MLFDLKGKRRRVIQVVYAMLAVLMGGSLVLFGIGSDAPGGILDGLGLTDGGGPSNPQYEQEIEAAEERLEVNPDDEQALLNLARYHYLSATTGITTDPETGQRQMSEEAREELDEALEAWERYLETDPKPPDPGLARNMTQVNEIVFQEALARGDVSEVMASAEGAADTYRVAIREEPTAPGFGAMAQYLYITGETSAADQAVARAVELADPGDRGALRRNLQRQAQQAKKLSRQLEQIAETGRGTEAIEDPLGGLGPGAPTPEPAP
jgi:tetratricopeptide (TPR) repeat protein